MAKVPNKEGDIVDITYNVDVVASVLIEWETDDQPTGWNYGTDQPIYTTYQYAVGSDPEIKSISFVSDEPFSINGNDLPIQQAQKQLGIEVIRQLLDPKLNADLLHSKFEKEVENMEPPSEEPEDRRDYDYDR